MSPGQYEQHYVSLECFRDRYNSAASSMKSRCVQRPTARWPGHCRATRCWSAQAQVSRLVTAKYGSGDLQTLSDLGISLQKDGTLKLDSTKLNKAIEADFSAVTT
jgi:flagellar hook-associated protein 2